MPPIISKLPSAHSNGLTPRSCKKNDSNNDVISDYYAGVSKRLKESESNGFASARVGCNRICNINSIHAASEELLCKKCVIDFRELESKNVVSDLEMCANEMTSIEGQLFMKEFLHKYKAKRRRHSVRRTA